MNTSGVYSKIDSFISGSINGQCGVPADIETSDLEISWYIDLGSRYSVETAVINYNYSGDSYYDNYGYQSCFYFYLYIYEDQ